MIQIAPSILSADFNNLEGEIKAVEKAGADAIHIDVMDGHFVPNISIGVPIVESVRKITKLPLDCHLMISEPEKYIEAFAKAGANWISVHCETCDLSKVLPLIREHGCKAGAVINPPTPLNKLQPFVEFADFILIMSVNPGFSGQKCIPESIEKTRELANFMYAKGLEIPIQIDGGITPENVGQVKEAGATIIVAASAIFKQKNYKVAIDALRNG